MLHFLAQSDPTYHERMMVLNDLLGPFIFTLAVFLIVMITLLVALILKSVRIRMLQRQLIEERYRTREALADPWREAGLRVTAGNPNGNGGDDGDIGDDNGDEEDGDKNGDGDNPGGGPRDGGRPNGGSGGNGDGNWDSDDDGPDDRPRKPKPQGSPAGAIDQS